jgi:hypothetical protein
MSDIVKQGDDFLVPYLNEDGTRGKMSLCDFIQAVMADELGYPVTSTIKQRLSHLRNDGGASS